jgi:predicted O-methyltransferase YrrM
MASRPRPSLLRRAALAVRDRLLDLKPNLRGAVLNRPGHFYSPLLDIESLAPGQPGLAFDGPQCWEHVDLRRDGQRAYFAELLERFPPLPFPRHRTPPWRYFWDNGDWFNRADAFTLAGVIRREQPRRVIEIGCGFSSAVTLDALEQAGLKSSLTFIEPNPDRLRALLTPAELAAATTCFKVVQEVPLEVFDALEASDVLFVDTSHVAKVGSDVTFIFLRVLPRLKPGVLVHFHDIFYPYAYPVSWIRWGRAFNETIILQTLLAQNPRWEVVAFNPYAGHEFPGLFRDRFPVFLEDTGGSIWLRKRS